MKRAAWVLVALISTSGLGTAKIFPPVLLSADLENRGQGIETENSAPHRYVLYVAPYQEFGQIAAGGQAPPSIETVARLVAATLPADRYVPIANDTETPEEVIGVHWGEVSPQGPQPFIGAREGGVVRPIWAIGVGRTHVPPFLTSSQRSDLREELSRDRFFLILSSYDAAALREGKVLIHWQTRLSIDSLQVRAGEAWDYLAGVAQTNLAKRIDRPAFVSDAPKLAPSSAAVPLVSIDEVIPGASKLLTFEKATPPY